MFTFSVVEVRAIITRGRTDAAANGGFRNPHYGLLPGKDERPALWIVGDEGVYVLSNGKLAEGQKALVVYAEECDPKTDPDCWHYKRRYFEGDDGIVFIAGASLEAMLSTTPEPTHLRAQFTSETIALVARDRCSLDEPDPNSSPHFHPPSPAGPVPRAMAHILEKESSMSNDPFTLDMFGSSALSSGLGLGVTAFGSFAANDDDPDPPPRSPSPALPPPVAKQPAPRTHGLRGNFYLDNGDRGLAIDWKQRAKANLVAILTANEIEKQDRPATRDEQAKLIRFTGFGASELANRMFRRPGDVDFQQGWGDLGSSLESAVTDADYASLARCTQYAHFTPEFIVRSIWAGLRRLGWRGGRVLEPGIGTGLFRR